MPPRLVDRAFEKGGRLRFGGSKQQEFILSTFWKPEVQNQGVSWDMLPLKALRENPALPFPASGSPSSPRCFLVVTVWLRPLRLSLSFFCAFFPVGLPVPFLLL